jgi:hypothetical protein
MDVLENDKNLLDDFICLKVIILGKAKYLPLRLQAQKSGPKAASLHAKKNLTNR